MSSNFPEQVSAPSPQTEARELRTRALWLGWILLVFLGSVAALVTMALRLAEMKTPRQAQLDYREAFTLRGFGTDVGSLAFHPDGTLLAVATAPYPYPPVGEVTVWDLAVPKQVHAFPEHQQGASVTFSPDGAKLAACDGRATVRLWDVTKEWPPKALVGNMTGIRHLAFSPDGGHLVGGAADGEVRIWNSTTGMPIHTLAWTAGLSGWDRPGLGWERVATFSPDGRLFAVSTPEHTVEVRELSTGNKVHSVNGALSCFSSDGRHLATGGYYGKAWVWDLATGKPVWTLSGHTYIVECLAYSPDGTLLVSADGSDTLRLWDTASGKEIFSQKQTATIRSIVFSPDGRRFAFALGNAVKVWEAKP